MTTPTIDTLDALFAAPAELDEIAAMPTALTVDVEGEDFEVRMISTLGTLAVKC